ncbi:Uncharacterised protein [uncultured archaeon]|nr:Uncharacterised protein [uncultured archaeon]
MPRMLTSKVGDIDKLVHWMDHVRKASKKFLIVCQHKKDRDFMRSLKCKNVLYVMEPMVDFVDLVVWTEKPVILLFDGDRNSNSKFMKLKSFLQQRGVKVNTGFRKIIFTMPCRSFSGLLKYLHQLAGSERVHSGLPV